MIKRSDSLIAQMASRRIIIGRLGDSEFDSDVD